MTNRIRSGRRLLPLALAVLAILMMAYAIIVKGGAMKDHRGGEKLCLSHKFAANCRGDDRYGIELTISAIDVIPSGF